MSRTEMRLTVLVCAIVVLAVPLLGSEDPPRVEDLAWLAGCWRGEADGVVMEEQWTAPAGGVMLGLHRDLSPAGGVFFEYLRIVATEDGVHYVASPSGRGETTFRLAEHGDHRVVFENPEHDFPKRISYRLEGSALHASIDGGAGDPNGWQWSWRRIECP